MPEARGDVRQIVGQPVFVPLYKLYQAYGKVLHSLWSLLSAVTCNSGGHLCVGGRTSSSGHTEGASQAVQAVG